MYSCHVLRLDLFTIWTQKLEGAKNPFLISESKEEHMPPPTQSEYFSGRRYIKRWSLCLCDTDAQKCWQLRAHLDTSEGIRSTGTDESFLWRPSGEIQLKNF